MTAGTLLLLATVAAASTPAAVAGPAPATGWPEPILRFCADAEGGAPYSFYDPDDPSKLIGFEIDIVEDVGRRTGSTPRFVQNAWDGLVQALNRGDCDVVINGIEVTPDRARVVEFSRPYYVFQQELTVRRDDDAIRGLADLEGKRAGTLSGSLARQMLEEIEGTTLVTYPGVLEPYRDLALGRIDAVLIDVPVAAYYARPDERLKRAAPPMGQGLYAAVIRKGEERRLAAMDAALGAMTDDGTLERILRKWHLWTDAQRELGKGRSLTELYSQIPALEIVQAIEEGRDPRPMDEPLERTPPGDSVVGGERPPDGAPALRRPESILRYVPALLRGAAMTVLLSVCGYALAVLLGLPIALLRIYGPAPVARALLVYTEVIRGTPLLIQLMLLYYGLPTVGIAFPAVTTAIVGLGLNYAAYEAEIYRAAILAIPPGQSEAALSLGMGRFQALRWVVVPQALRISLPPSTNDFIALFKDSSLVSVITVVELTKTFSIYAASTYTYAEIGALTAALYLAMSLPLAALARRLERNLQKELAT